MWPSLTRPMPGVGPSSSSSASWHHPRQLQLPLPPVSLLGMIHPRPGFMLRSSCLPLAVLQLGGPRPESDENQSVRSVRFFTFKPFKITSLDLAWNIHPKEHSCGSPQQESVTNARSPSPLHTVPSSKLPAPPQSSPGHSPVSRALTHDKSAWTMC